MTEKQLRHVAIVDDDFGVLESFRFMLEMSGFLVATYTSAAAYLESGLTDPRCLILDQHMPALTGLDLAEVLRARGIDVPVLLVTSSPSLATRKRAAALGIRRILEKPPAESDVIAFVQGCI